MSSYSRVPGDRAGQGYGRTLPKRNKCPKCGKKGVFKPDRSRWPESAHFAWEYRECQYCRSHWNSGNDWGHAVRHAREKADAAIAKATGAQS